MLSYCRIPKLCGTAKKLLWRSGNDDEESNDKSISEEEKVEVEP